MRHLSTVPETPEPLMTVPAVAAYLNVKVSWVYDHRRELPFFKVGNQLRARRTDLDQWLTGQRAA
ncbi:helix-turn-helix domain-containing protein [Spirillospora sp. CA-253888]